MGLGTNFYENIRTKTLFLFTKNRHFGHTVRGTISIFRLWYFFNILNLYTILNIQICTLFWTYKSIHNSEHTNLYTILNIQIYAQFWTYKSIHNFEHTNLYTILNIQIYTQFWTYKSIRNFKHTYLYTILNMQIYT